MTALVNYNVNSNNNIRCYIMDMGVQMFIHIGGSQIVFNSDLIGIFNLELKGNNVNKMFLNSASTGSVTIMSKSDQPKSFIVTDNCVYISPIAPLTLSRRQNPSRQP